MRLRRLSNKNYIVLLMAITMAGPLIMLMMVYENERRGRSSGLGEQIFLPREIAADVAQSEFGEQKYSSNRRRKSAKLQRIDWHDYRQIEFEKSRKGTGEHNEPVKSANDDDLLLKNRLYELNGFNAYASDKISWDRAIKDLRNPGCWNETYLAHLPNVSIVIPVHNEHWSILLRSIHSILNRSPPQLIHEIILVDDYSDKVHHREQLEYHLRQGYYGKVRVLRQIQREGLIRTKINGARVATGEVLLFLDSHVEVGINWLPPLLEPIAEDYRTATCPLIDIIEKDDFVLQAQDDGGRGIFDWQMFYERLLLSPEAKRRPTDPIESPVMAGGLFAISAKWFWELGGYDPGLEFWGGEQFELSFKIWMCGGRMVDMPCSRVGHVYRAFNPFQPPTNASKHYAMRNHLRVAEVWMDEYKQYVIKHNPAMTTLDPGDLTEQKQLRSRLQCKSFDWFIKEVAYGLIERFPPEPPPPIAAGEIRSIASNLCIDTKFKDQKETFGLDDCISDNRDITGEQEMELTWRRELRPIRKPLCFDASGVDPRGPVILFFCHLEKGNQWWKYDVDTKQLLHVASEQCLDCDFQTRQIFMFPCNPDSITQKWKWGHVDEKEARIAWEEKPPLAN